LGVTNDSRLDSLEVETVFPYRIELLYVFLILGLITNCKSLVILINSKIDIEDH
jgi:hypothetical protein